MLRRNLRRVGRAIENFRGYRLRIIYAGYEAEIMKCSIQELSPLGLTPVVYIGFCSYREMNFSQTRAFRTSVTGLNVCSLAYMSRHLIRESSRVKLAVYNEDLSIMVCFLTFEVLENDEYLTFLKAPVPEYGNHKTCRSVRIQTVCRRIVEMLDGIPESGEL